MDCTEHEGSVEQLLESALSMLGMCDSPLSLGFFSVENVDRIQESIKIAVKQESGHVIDRQSDRELISIMKGVYEAFAGNVYRFDKKEIRRLNAVVVDITVDQITAGIQGYLQYIHDASTMPEPLSRGEFASVKGTKNLEMTYGFVSEVPK